MPGRISENHLQTIRDQDAWAIYKLWTNWNTPVDLSWTSMGDICTAGAATRSSVKWGPPRRGRGRLIAPARQSKSRSMSARPRSQTLDTNGHRVTRQGTETALTSLNAVFNGGAVNDQKGFDFGNETDGWYYAGSCWMYGATLAARDSGHRGLLSAHPYDAAQAFREHLAHVLSTLDEQGRAHFGYNQGGEWVDDNLHTIIGMRFYLLHSGDLDFVYRTSLPALERMLAYFAQRRDPQGLFKLDDVGTHWYYDAITTSGVNGYYNAFFYKAACDLAEMEHAAGRNLQARE